MPSYVDLKCQNCGATIDAAVDAVEFKCDYCGHRFHLADEPSRPSPPPPAPAPEPYVPPRRPTAIARALSWGLPLLLGAVGLYLSRRHPIPDTVKTLLRDAVSTATPTHSYWDSVGGAPALAEVDDREGVVGRLRVNPGDHLYTVFIDGKTARAAWRAGPWGTYAEAYRATRHAVVGEHVVVSDFRGKLHLLALATGLEEHAVALTDKVEHLCALPDGAHAWVGTVDKRGVLVDVATGGTAIAARPDACKDDDGFAGSRRHDRAAPRPPSVTGFKSEVVRSDGDNAVAVGVKSPGTAVPMAVGFDARLRAARWTTTIPSVDGATVREMPPWDFHAALAGGRLVTVYGVGAKGFRLVALDAASGARVWDVALRRLFAVDNIGGLILSDKHAYVVRTSSLDVYDAATGRLVGAVGDETYE